MGIIDKIKWGWDKLSVLESLIKKWRPRGCESERDYENSLYQFLWRELPDHDITRQSAKGRFRADIVLDGKIIIEIKNNLDSTANYQRLVGQIEE